MPIAKYLKLAGGSLLFAALAYGLLAAPGLLSDTASTVPLVQPRVAVHP